MAAPRPQVSVVIATYNWSEALRLSLASALGHEQLVAYVRHDANLFPESKMPQFSKLLTPAQLDRVVSYLEVMQPSR